MENELQVISENTDIVTIPRAEYDELLKARLSIDMIGSTLNAFGGEDKIVVAVCKQFGYEKPEAELNA